MCNGNRSALLLATSSRRMSFLAFAVCRMIVGLVCFYLTSSLCHFQLLFFFCVSLHKCTLYFTMQRMTTPVERRYVCEGKPLALQKLILCLITMESYRTPLKSESFVVFLRQFITTKATAPKEAKVLTKESHIRKRLSLYF